MGRMNTLRPMQEIFANAFRAVSRPVVRGMVNLDEFHEVV